MKFIRVLLSITLLILVVSGLVLGALYYSIDPNQLKPVIVAEVKKQTGFTLSIEGKLSWKLYPYLAIHVPEMIFVEPGQTNIFADLKNTMIAVDVKEALQGHGKLQGNIRIGYLTLMNIQLNGISTDLSWQNGVMRFKPIQASLYGGSLKGTVNGRDLSKVPKWDWDLAFNHVQVKALLADINPTAKLVVNGWGDFTMHAETIGKSSRQMTANLNGNTAFSVKDGEIEGVDLNYFIKAADAVLNKQPVPAPEDLAKTSFSTMTGAAVIQNGVAAISNVQLLSSTFKTTAEGHINLLSNDIDIHIRTVPQQQIQTQWEAPIILTGNLQHPNVKLDTDQLTKYVIKEKIEKVKDKARDLIKKHVSGEAGQFLQQLLSN